ncbi:MAG: universal stress protein [Sandaracinaceae bacterium]
MEYKHIVGATDFSELGDIALTKAANLAAAAACKLTALTVLPQPEMPSPLVSHYEVHTDADQREKAVEAARAALEERIPDAVKESGITIEYQVRIGDPTDEILTYDVEQKPDLIVLATHGRRGWKRFIMGSVSERVVQFAHADVLSVRETPPELG